MRKPVKLITGANGELGRGLLEHFFNEKSADVVAVDLKPLAPEIAKNCIATIAGDILDRNLLQRLVSEFEIHEIYHLAALLSTRSEYTPDIAHAVNVNGTLNLLELAHEQSRWHGNTVKFLFPSSIAVYGLPDRKTKDHASPLRESDYNFPITMYGCNKLYCEQLGRYFTLHFRQLAADRQSSGIDFRAIRYPGLISAVTKPSGGTSDYAPEMIHAAAQNENYAAFVDEKTQLPFMAMPDAIRALVLLADAPAEALKQRVYNVTAFSLAAKEIKDHILKLFPQAKIIFKPDPPRAHIVDTWPGDVNDEPARRDWKWKPLWSAESAFADYLFPTISKFYRR